MKNNGMVYEFTIHYEGDDTPQKRFVFAETEEEAIEKLEAYNKEMTGKGFEPYIIDPNPILENQDVIY